MTDLIETAQTAREVLLLKMGDLFACIDIANVERTISLVAMQVVPGSAAYVVGIMNYAGSSLPVIDLAIRLGRVSAPYTLDTPIMVCVHGQQRLGVIVQNIEGIQSLCDHEQQLTHELARHGELFCASAHTRLGLALILDAAWLMQFGMYPSVSDGDV